MPEAAFFVRQHRITCGVIEEHDFLPGIALVMFVHRIKQRNSDARTVPLRYIAIALIDRRLQLNQRFLRTTFVIKTNYFYRVVACPFFLIRHLGYRLKTFQEILTDRCKWTR